MKLPTPEAPVLPCWGNNSMKFLTPALFIFLWLIILANTQSKLHIIHSDYNIGRKVNGQQLRILKGSVHVRKDTVNMFCDSAYFFETRNVLELMGRVIVINGKRKIQARKIIYFPDENVTECLGNVRASSPDDSLYTKRLLYNLKVKEATANQEVFLLSKNDNVIITGQNGYFNDAANYLKISQNSYLMQIDTAKNDTFQVWSKTLEYYGDTLNYAKAIDSVIIKQNNFTAHCDTAWYYSKLERSLLRGKPQVWFDKSELTGDFIDAEFDSSALKHIDIRGNARAKTLHDSARSEYNIITGKKLEFFIKDKNPSLIIGRDNASSIYYIDQENDSGSNYSTSDSIFVYFKEGELDSIRIVGGAQGTYYPDIYKGEKSFDQ